MDYYYNILITGCSSGLGEALFNKVWEHDFLKPFGHYRTEDGDPYALIGDITDSDFPEKLDNYIREREIDCFINNAGVYQGDIIDTNLGSQSIQIESDDGVLVKSIFHYCDLMRSSFGIIGLYSGQSALSAAILEYNPDLLSFCMVSEAVYKKHSLQSGFIFDKLNYVIIPETEEVLDTSIH